MTTPAPPGDLTAGYDRPPYWQPSVPRREPREWVLDLLLPWRLASRVYGPYRMLRMSASGVAAEAGAELLDPVLQPMVTQLVAQTLDPLVERLIWARALFGLGVILFVVRLATGASADELFQDAFGDSIVVLLTGPVALLLACVPLVLLARTGTRRRVGRLVARPLFTGVVTFAAFLALMKSDPGAYVGNTVGLHLLLLIWLPAFTLPTVYLIHRNSFAMRAHPLVRPLVAVLLVWLTLIGHVTLVDTKGTTTSGAAALAGLLVGPVGVTVTAVIELVRLRRRHRVGFRGPLPPLPPQEPRGTRGTQ
ncbi:hypothetical protein OG455_21180 [Kitasatospora sp. NBC_01287]|uniref:hypothetical protein n=1 Tax=Kitasatospora sp. NBC_01287 TaxID=2903573 RepID=UPI00224D0B4D|nr:hypothetical protein [Kitasatospora sp. NBC_01287]MCX4747997.1 hypothetical protein [Kitasatospora sp. NBC_01287]